MPVNRLTVRKLPFNMVADAQEAIQKLVKKGVIEEVMEPTVWCAPSQFLRKPKGHGVRLVNNFIGINRIIYRVGHLLASPSQIMAEILPGSPIFFTLDFTPGYFQ